MRILFTDLYDAHFKMGGAERVLWDIAKFMKDRYGDTIACAVNPGDLEQAFRNDGFSTFELAWEKMRTLKTIAGLKLAVSDFKPDIIHSHHRFTTFLLQSLKIANVPVLHTEHVLRTNHRLFFRYGTFATAVHETVRENLIRHYRVPSEKVMAIPNAISLPPLNPAKVESFKKQWTGQNRRIALVLGRLEEQKGHIYLVRAVAELSEESRKDLRILLAGTGSLESQIKDEIQKLGVAKTFEFLGHCKEIAELLAVCDFLILPSLWEGMPLSILEAYAAGKPVLATDIPGTRELVLPDKTGILVEVKNPVRLAAGLEKMIHGNELKAMGLQAGQFSEKHFSQNIMMERYQQLYNKLIGVSHGG